MLMAILDRLDSLDFQSRGKGPMRFRRKNLPPSGIHDGLHKPPPMRFHSRTLVALLTHVGAGFHQGTIAVA